MCSICGGTKWNKISEEIFTRSKDRGRDDHGLKILETGQWIGNHRATPTTETEKPIERQPVGNSPWYVFNGIISNDHQLGIRDGEADTSVIPRIINLDSLESFAFSIQNIIGSYAIASLENNGSIYLACNYKPIWILHHDNNLYFSSLQHHFPDELQKYSFRMNPYSVLELNEKFNSINLNRTQPNNALVICSSGLDSTSVASYAKILHDKVVLIYFNYGCRASIREIECVGKISKYLDCTFEILDISKNIFGTSSPLMNSESNIASGVAGAEFAHEWVPARNLVMLSLTVAYAEAYNFGHIYLGTNLEEAGAYPDNEEQFIIDFRNILWGAVQNNYKVDIHTPLGGLMKHEVVKFGLQYNAPFDLTWSCYLGEQEHCGNCGPCFMRKTAFERNNMKDPVMK